MTAMRASSGDNARRMRVSPDLPVTLVTLAQAPRKGTKFEHCERHAPWFAGETRRRQIECMVEGGPGGWSPGCSGGQCRIWPGTDAFEPSVCHGEMDLDWTKSE